MTASTIADFLSQPPNLILWAVRHGGNVAQPELKDLSTWLQANDSASRLSFWENHLPAKTKKPAVIWQLLHLGWSRFVAQDLTPYVPPRDGHK